MTWKIQPRSEGAGGLTCYRAGKGAPLVLIHGVGLRSEAWGALLPLLAAEFQVIAVDMPGHGGSQPLGTALVRLSDFTEAFAEFLRPFGRPVAVAGHSMGAMIALDLAIRHPQMVTSVIAMNAIFQRGEVAQAAVQARAAALDPNVGMDPAATLSRWFGDSSTGALTEARDACRRWLVDCDPAGYAAAYRVFSAHDGPDPDDLVRLAAPALFITGANEPNSTPAMSQTMSGLVPHGSVQIIPGAAHMAPMTHPDPIAAAMIRHLSRQVAA